MSRPLLITDCDEVLLHMLAHFTEWLDEAHEIAFDLDSGGFAEALTDKASGVPLPHDRIWPLLDEFFRTEMHRQTLVPGAYEALERIGGVADIVVLTNIGHEAHGWRVEQLAGHGIAHELICNQGGKGPAVAEIVARHAPSATVFVDDLALHHASVARHAAEVSRLHMVAEPRFARVTPPAQHAHARIDEWEPACEWILARFEGAA